MAQPIDDRLQGAPYRLIGESKTVGRNDDPGGQGIGSLLPEQHGANLAQRHGVAGEIADGIERGRLGHHAGDGDAAMSRPQAVNPAEARGYAYRAAGVSTQSNIDQAAGDGGSGAARRAARYAVRR